MSDEEILAEMQSDSLLNKMRQMFSGERARIEQAAQQRVPLTPIQFRRMEFEAAEKLMLLAKQEESA